MKTVISYLYGEEINIEWDDILDYTDIAEMWQLIEFKEHLEDYMVTNVKLNRHVHCNWLDIADKYNMEKLERKIQSIDAPTKLRACITFVQTGDENCASLYMDFLHRFKLTKCSPAFIEMVLKSDIK